jgi:hypothetical protein
MNGRCIQACAWHKLNPWRSFPEHIRLEENDEVLVRSDPDPREMPHDPHRTPPDSDSEISERRAGCD